MTQNEIARALWDACDKLLDARNALNEVGTVLEERHGSEVAQKHSAWLYEWASRIEAIESTIYFEMGLGHKAEDDAEQLAEAL